MQYARFIGEQKPGQTRVLRSNMITEDGDNLIKDFEGMATIQEAYEKNYKEQPEKPYLGTREKTVGEDGKIVYGPYQWKSLGDCYEDSKAIAKYLMTNALCPEIQTEEGRFRFLAIFAKNREEWTVSDLAAQMTSITCVTLYDTLGKDSLQFILNQTQIRTCVISADKIRVVLDLHKEGKLDHL